MQASLPWIAGSITCILAAIYDLRSRRIPNALTITLLACAPVLAGISGGFGSAALSIAIAITVLLTGFALFAFGMIGAGDAKMLAGLAALCGYPRCIDFVLYTAVSGGVLAAVAAASRGELLSMITRLHVRVGASIASGGLRTAVAAQSDTRLPYAFAMSAGFALVILSLTAAPFLRIAP